MSNFRVAHSSWLTQRPATLYLTVTLLGFQIQSLSQYLAAYRCLSISLPLAKSRESCGLKQSCLVL